LFHPTNRLHVDAYPGCEIALRQTVRTTGYPQFFD